uniref:Poly [ADP-ribose] polymerase n=1 Tax=Heterorhabditis bacteriophora TaxID=37862 RepID=A0A1I7XG30_HETBA
MDVIFSFGSTTDQQVQLTELLKEIGVKVKDFSYKTHYLVASSVMDLHYRKAVALGIPVMKEDFVIECVRMRVRHEREIENLANSFKLPRFEGLTICFAGYDMEQIRDDAYNIESYGGRVCDSIANATHIVVAPETRIPITTNNQNMVTIGWLRESMDLEWCANEKSFIMPTTKIKLQRRNATKTALYDQPMKRLFRNKREFRSDCSITKYKRYQLCLELWKTEINCLKIVDFLLRMKEDNIYISPTHNEVIFGSLVAMKDVHSKIVENMGIVIDKWNDDSIIGKVFVDESTLLEMAYIPYFQGLEASIDLFKELKTNNSRFRAFIEVDYIKEKDRTLDKQKIDYLLNVPYQQLTGRVSISLKEILNKTDREAPDCSHLKRAIATVAEVLRKSNESKKMSIESEVLYKQVENIPASILCTSRQFLSRMKFISLSHERNGPKKKKVPVELLLFQDTVMSFSMSSVREIYMHGIDDDLTVVIFTLRDDTGDLEWFFQAKESTENTILFLKKVVDQVFLLTKRLINISSYSDRRNKERNEKINLMVRSLSCQLSSSLRSSAFGKLRSYSHKFPLLKESRLIKRHPSTPLTNKEKNTVKYIHQDNGKSETDTSCNLSYFQLPKLSSNCETSIPRDSDIGTFNYHSQSNYNSQSYITDSEQSTENEPLNPYSTVKKSLQDELNRLAAKFQMANTDVVSKLPINFETAKVDSAVSQILEGQSLHSLMDNIKKDKAAYISARDAKKSEELARAASLKQ